MKFHRTTEHPKRVGGTREAITIRGSESERESETDRKREKERKIK